MNYRILMHVEVQARDAREAAEIAKRLKTMLQGPMVRMGIESENIRLANGDGRPVVYAPEPCG